MKWIAATESGLIPASHEDPRAPGVLKRVIATRESFQAGHVQMLNWAVLPGNSSFQRHFHQDMQETFVILSGEVEMHVAGERRVMQAGDTVIVDPGEIHQMRNLRAEEARYIVFGISSGQGGRTIVIVDSDVNETSASAG
ncbi:MAG: cupin domain-containing protein [Planctomycetia bacterium]